MSSITVAAFSTATQKTASKWQRGNPGKVGVKNSDCGSKRGRWKMRGRGGEERGKRKRKGKRDSVFVCDLCGV